MRSLKLSSLSTDMASKHLGTLLAMRALLRVYNPLPFSTLQQIAAIDAAITALKHEDRGVVDRSRYARDSENVWLRVLRNGDLKWRQIAREPYTYPNWRVRTARLVRVAQAHERARAK